jgi:lysophospholipase L1-like esterase
MRTIHDFKTCNMQLMGRRYFSYWILVSGLIALSFCVQPNPKLIMVGDSTMADKPERALPENGWGMALLQTLSPGTELKNFARNGRSSKSFFDEGSWSKAAATIAAGDYVIIQFGHNDEKNQDSTRYTVPRTSYKEYLRKYITDTRSKGGIPVLCTSIVRRKFDHSGNLVSTHGDYPEAMRELAVEMNVWLIDLETLTAAVMQAAGPEKSRHYYMNLAAGEHPNFPEGKEDNTHLQVKGAGMVAGLFISEVKKMQWPLSHCFR